MYLKILIIYIFFKFLIIIFDFMYYKFFNNIYINNATDSMTNSILKTLVDN